MVKIARFLVLRPKIKFYLFAIGYLPTLFLPTQLFFLHFQNSFCFSFLSFFCILLYQCLAEIPKLYKLTRKPQDH